MKKKDQVCLEVRLELFFTGGAVYIYKKKRIVQRREREREKRVAKQSIRNKA